MLRVLAFLLLGRPLRACTSLSIDGRFPLSRTAAFYASWNVDSSRQRAFFGTNFADPRLLYLASLIGGARIRFGGTGNDYLHYEVPGATPCSPTVPYAYECLNSTWVDNLFALSSAANSPLIFGLNITGAASAAGWDPSNAVALLRYARARNNTLFALELGNEQNSKGLTFEQQAAAYAVLSGALDEVFPAGDPTRPLLVGPDPSGFHVAPSLDPKMQSRLDFLVNFTNAAGAGLSAVTHHEYIEIDAANATSSAFLDATRQIGRQVVAAVRGTAFPDMPVWAGEIGPHNGGNTPPNCEGNGVCGRYGSALWYADAMGAKAREGYAAFFRQDFLGADYGLVNYTSFAPSPDFWLLAIWRRAVGTGVLNVSQAQAPYSHTTRVYAFCGRISGTFALVVVNLNAAASACVAAPGLAGAAPRTQWVLQPGQGGVLAAEVLLNGSPLALDAGGRAPDLSGAAAPAGEPLTVPPLGIALALWSTNADACAA
jgi:heparanase 1